MSGRTMFSSSFSRFRAAVTLLTLFSLTDYRCVNTLLKYLLRGKEMA